MDNKTCPICKINHPISHYGKYFSKERQKFRYQNYCNGCQKTEKKKRSAEYFQRNKDARLQYARNYRADPKNKSKLQEISQKFKIKYRSELKGCYVRDQIKQKTGIPTATLRKNPDLVQAYKLKLQISRKIKSHGTKQNDRP
ncbi:MAG: hypothetical protein EOO20_16060 [Chryseobacterium sp.]|nr:MAG: hypothetical protein EOO20_16060 [Chryseobacterium sp.]